MLTCVGVLEHHIITEGCKVYNSGDEGGEGRFRCTVLPYLVLCTKVWKYQSAAGSSSVTVSLSTLITCPEGERIRALHDRLGAPWAGRFFQLLRNTSRAMEGKPIGTRMRATVQGKCRGAPWACRSS